MDGTMAGVGTEGLRERGQGLPAAGRIGPRESQAGLGQGSRGSVAEVGLIAPGPPAFLWLSSMWRNGSRGTSGPGCGCWQ